MKSVLLGVVGAGLIGTAEICDLCRPHDTAGVAVAPASAEVVHSAAAVPDTQTVALRVEGMTCGGCAISARVVLERLEGVNEAEVEFEEKLAIVTYDPEKITPAQMIAALREKLNYTATVVAPKDG